MHEKSSVEPSEVSKFSKLSDKWWDSDGEFKILHKINPLRIEFIIDKIRHHFNVKNLGQALGELHILDVGCGGGLVDVELAKLGANITAIDASAENINAAKEYARIHKFNIDFYNSTVEKMTNSASKLYDVVLCLEVIEHVSNVEDFVKNLCSLVKPNGMLILSTINRNVKSYLLGIIMAEYILNWVPRQTHDHSKFLKPSELNLLLDKNNMCIKELKGLTFNPFIQTWNLSYNIDVNYFAYVTKQIV